MAHRMIHLSLDGNISSGKSRLLSEYKLKFQNEGLFTIDEPLSQYCHYVTSEDKISINPLDIFYQDKSNSLAFQMNVLDIFKKIFTDLPKQCLDPTTTILSDRSMLGSYVFTNHLYKNGHIPHFGYYYWQTAYHQAKTIANIMPDAVFFLETPVSTCYSNMLHRGRTMETRDPGMEDYLVSISDSYDFILNKYVESGGIVKRTKTYDLSSRVMELHDFVQKTKQHFGH